MQLSRKINIMLTCPCNVYCKIGVYRVIHYFLRCALKYRLCVLTCTQNLCFEQNKKNIKTFHLKIIIFTAFKNRCILHRYVFFVMLITECTYNGQTYTAGDLFAAEEECGWCTCGDDGNVNCMSTPSCIGLYR